MSLERREST